MNKTDVVIIGAGAVGCAIARELSKYEIDIVVVEANSDVGGGASKSNSAIIHTGYDATPNTLESQLVVSANPMYDQLTKDLDIPFKRVGAILPAITDEQFQQLPAIKNKAFKNHVYNIEYLNSDELLAMEPNLNPEVKGGLYIPDESIICPFIMVQALAENAFANGAKFLLNTKVIGIKQSDGKITHVETTNGIIQTTYVINAAGLFCDEIASMVGKNTYEVIPRRGQFFVLDKKTDCKVNHIVLPIPTKVTKGKLMCPTIHGNMLIGPTAEDLDNKYDRGITIEGLNSILQDVKKLIPTVNPGDNIVNYSGLRANRVPEGLHFDMYDDLKGYINLSGIRSTGLTLSVSMAKYVVQQMIESGSILSFKKSFIRERKGIIKFDELSLKEKSNLISKNPSYGNVICRCETVTEGQVLDAIHRPLGATTVDAVKRRVRSGTGRCQGGFCTPRIIDILARELGVSKEKINKELDGSYMITGKTR